MRAISIAGLERRWAESQRIAWLLTLADGAWTWRGATRGIVLGGENYPARLAAVERWREQVGESSMPGGRVRGEAVVRVVEAAAAADSLRARLAQGPPIGVAATLQLVWLGESNPEPEDAAVMLRGRLTQWRIGPTGVSLEMADDLHVQSGRRVGRLLRREMIGGQSSPWLGRTLPWIFGRLEHAPLVPLLTGAEGMLAESIDAAASVIPLISLAGFPPHGVAQIDGEQVEYTITDPTALTLGTPARPVTRGATPAAHARGALVRQVPDAGFEFLVADHPCRSVEQVFADGFPLSAELWTATERALGEHIATVVRLPAWPLNEEGKQARELTAGVEGLADELDALIENPADVIETLLTHPRLAALDTSRLDATSFAMLRAHLSARGYRFARRVSGEQSLGELIDGAAREAGVWLGGGDPLHLILADPLPHPANVEETLDSTRALVAGESARVESPAGLLPPDAIELVGASAGLGQGRPSHQFPPESLASGVIPRRFQLDWLDLAEEGAAGDLGGMLWAHLTGAPFEYAQSYPLGAALLLAGETVQIDDAPIHLQSALGWVRAIEAGPGARARLVARGPWANEFCWTGDADNFIRRMGFGGQIVFVVGGRPIARLERGGTLRIAGRLREAAVIAGGPFDAPIEIDAGGIVLSIGEAGTFTPFLRLESNGDAYLTGSVREHSTLDFDPAGLCFGAETDRLWFAPDPAAGAFEYRADDERLHLAGMLIESFRL